MSEVPLYLPFYRGTSPTRKRTPLGPYRRPMPRVLGGSYGGGRFLMSEVPLWVKRLTGCGLLRLDVELHKVTSLIRKRFSAGPYSQRMSRAVWWSWGRDVFL